MSQLSETCDSTYQLDTISHMRCHLRGHVLLKYYELREYLKFQCPVAFAMHLYIDKENLNKQLDSTAQLKTPDGCTAPGNYFQTQENVWKIYSFSTKK